MFYTGDKQVTQVAKMESNMLSGCYQEHDDSSSDNESTTSPVHMDRKRRKPLMEKKRRARINASLDELKKLVLDAMKKDSARYSKLEKADILELTVRHLREAQQQNMNVAMTHDSSVASKYQAGFNECLSEVNRYLSSVDGMSSATKLRLMQHLSQYSQHLDQSHKQSMQYQLPLGNGHFTPTPQGSSQPLQIQIPSTTPSSSLPGHHNRSPEPATLPPSPPSSDDLYGGPWKFIPEAMNAQLGQLQLGQYPIAGNGNAQRRVARVAPSSLGPLRGKENLAVNLSQRYSPIMSDSHSRKSPEQVAASIKRFPDLATEWYLQQLQATANSYQTGDVMTSSSRQKISTARQPENRATRDHIKTVNAPTGDRIKTVDSVKVEHKVMSDEEVWRPWNKPQ